MFLNRDLILTQTDLPHRDLLVPEWGGTVRVRTMSGAQRDRFEADHLREPNSNLRARLAAATICDERGEPIFTPADAEALGRTSAAALDRVFAAALELNKLRKEDVDALEGNS
jgi:hypothetical protein